ncbi:MAG TPA: hypothetical protein VMV06_12005 [Acidimicrobiales bacterium]|nr:hypothetical protein [Acidimicrobiales bacterium]
MRPGQLTRALSAPPTCSVDDACRAHLRDRLSSGLAPLVERLPRRQRLVVNLSDLRRARERPDSPSRQQEPFAWKPVFVRRSLGLAVVDACAVGRFRSPAEAVGPVASEAVAEWERTGWRAFHWEPWFAGLHRGARALVLSEAVTWATSLWASFDWAAFNERPRVGGGDDQWVCPDAGALILKGRSELRVPLAATGPDGAAGPVALACVAGGRPSDEWAAELAYPALVAALRSPTRPVPARVAGLWPDAGIHLVVDIDGEVLASAVDRVVAKVHVMVEARRLLAQPA